MLFEKFCTVGTSVAVEHGKKIIGLSFISEDCFLFKDATIFDSTHIAIFIVAAFTLFRAYRIFLCLYFFLMRNAQSRQINFLSSER
jgi:hypothetical protein